MCVQVRLHSRQVALDGLCGAARQLDLAEHKKHSTVAVEPPGGLRVDDIPEKEAAFRDFQSIAGREQGAGHHRFHWLPSPGGPGIYRMAQACVDFPGLGLRHGKVHDRRWGRARRRRRHSHQEPEDPVHFSSHCACCRRPVVSSGLQCARGARPGHGRPRRIGGRGTRLDWYGIGSDVSNYGFRYCAGWCRIQPVFELHRAR